MSKDDNGVVGSLIAIGVEEMGEGDGVLAYNHGAEGGLFVITPTAYEGVGVDAVGDRLHLGGLLLTASPEGKKH
jgi:hypothetical protein